MAKYQLHLEALEKMEREEQRKESIQQRRQNIRRSFLERVCKRQTVELELGLGKYATMRSERNTNTSEQHPSAETMTKRNFRHPLYDEAHLAQLETHKQTLFLYQLHRNRERAKHRERARQREQLEMDLQTPFMKHKLKEHAVSPVKYNIRQEQSETMIELDAFDQKWRERFK